MKSASRKWEDAWIERLRFVGEDRLVVLARPDSPVLRIEAYVTASQARDLVGRFGGRSTLLPARLPAPPAKTRPLSIRGKLKIFGDEKAWRNAGGPGGGRIFIPPGMAFGTGEHATTATCLRLLCDFSPRLPKAFHAADAGTGSGILALGAASLGAGSVEAFDNDPDAVRTARTNADANHAGRTLRVRKATIESWNPRPHSLDLISANLFSELLIPNAKKFSEALRPGGLLILSGVLAGQFPEVRAAMENAALEELATRPRGKWVAAAFGRRGGPPGTSFSLPTARSRP